MTTAVNLRALQNASLFCRQGNARVSRISRSSLPIPPETASNMARFFLQFNDHKNVPVGFKNNSSINMKESSSSTALLDEKLDERQQPQNAIVSKKRQRSVVRFCSTDSDQSEPNQGSRSRKSLKRKEFDELDADFWWSPGELKDIQEKCVSSVKKIESGLPLPSEDADYNTLEQYSRRNQKRRRLARLQVKETLRAVKAFEASTNVKTPPELLSQLLSLHSSSTVCDANRRGLQLAASCTNM